MATPAKILLMPLTLAVTISLGMGCDTYPKDPNSSLARAHNNVLRVGAVAGAAGLKQHGKTVAGPDAELIQQFAQSINAQVVWLIGSENEVMPLLEHNELDLVVGGLTKDTPWQQRVGLSKPYRTETVIVCSTQGKTLPKKLHNTAVAVTPGTGIIATVKKHGGDPFIIHSVAGYQGLIAVYERDAQKMGCTTANLPVAKHEYVIAITQGENALLVALEEYLHNAGF